MSKPRHPFFSDTPKSYEPKDHDSFVMGQVNSAKKPNFLGTSPKAHDVSDSTVMGSVVKGEDDPYKNYKPCF